MKSEIFCLLNHIFLFLISQKETESTTTAFNLFFTKTLIFPPIKHDNFSYLYKT
jgi:hypothetical protein